MGSDAGLASPERLTRAVDVLRRGIDAGAMPGATVYALRDGEPILDAALGTLDGSRPTDADTLYDLASISKPMGAGAAIVTLLERGDLLLGTPVSDLLGQAAAHLSRVTVGHLLTHTSGLPPWIPCYDNGYGHDAAVEAILRIPTAAPDSAYAYSCLNFILLHRIVETVSGEPLDAFVRGNVTEPLGLSSVGYNPDPALRPRIAPTIPREGPDKDSTLTGVVHDGNARGIGGVSGNAGLFGTARDIAAFGEAVLHGTLFGAPTRARVLTSQAPAAVGGHTLLFFAAPNGLNPVGDLLSPQAVGHSGYTGTLLTLDPAYGLVVAVLTNAVYGDGKASWLQVRRRFLNALAASLL